MAEMLICETAESLPIKEFIYELTEIGVFNNSEFFSEEEREVKLFILAEIIVEHKHDNQEDQSKGAVIGRK